MDTEKLTDKLAEIVASLQGPGFEAAKGAASVEAMSVLASGVICAALAVGAAYFARWAWRKVKAINDDLDSMGYSIVGILAALLSAGLGCRALWAFADPWTWVTITSPELWLAKRVLGL